MPTRRLTVLPILVAFAAVGCRSPYYADQGAMTGGMIGSGVGAIVGHQSGNTAEGAIVGAAIGALSGAIVGEGLDEIEARNRAQIAQQLGREVAPGAVHLGEVIAMSQAGVDDRLIASHVQANGLTSPLTSQDLIALNDARVSPEVVAAMQAPPRVAAIPVAPGPPAVVVPGPWHGPPPPCVGPHGPPYFRPHRPGWRVGVGH